MLQLTTMNGWQTLFTKANTPYTVRINLLPLNTSPWSRSLCMYIVPHNDKWFSHLSNDELNDADYNRHFQRSVPEGSINLPKYPKYPRWWLATNVSCKHILHRIELLTVESIAADNIKSAFGPPLGNVPPDDFKSASASGVSVLEAGS